MESPTFLTDPAAPAVIDTSAAINLVATGYAAEILKALPNRILAVEAVPAELEEGRRRGRKDADLLDDLVTLVTARLIEIVALDDAAIRTFEQLVVGPAAMTLDDGEAATIAYGLEHGGIAVIDERKATRICAERYPALKIGCTVDLFTHPNVAGALGRERLSQAVVNALRHARMRVQLHHARWVVELIGAEQAALCLSLPRIARATERQSASRSV